ncbi:tripartite tricarboxylate transporter permease [Paenochrobactrum glaciei]|uniref:Tripartite tricarboxylate transporter permease n=1 Tax=Paenochrobactrum glaciei TaxID=486407 RepID=A0ABN1GM93_9HYPH
MTAFVDALPMVLSFDVLSIIIISAAFGLFVGATPGLSATMAVALIVPVTFFLSPVAAIGAIITCSAMAIFAGDIPGALLRIPGTPASAAYVNDTYELNKQGKLALGLGTTLTTSAIGGIIGTVILVIAAPQLASFALNFSSYEYFWLALLGLSCATIVAPGDPIKAWMSLFLGVLLSTVGLDVVSGQQRFTFGIIDLQAGVPLIVVLIAAFAIAELFRKMTSDDAPVPIPPPLSFGFLRGQGAVLWKYKTGITRGSLTGTFVGALPGAGSDIAAWISYAISKRFSKTPEKYGTGHLEGVAEAGASNNAALSGSYVPTLVFGIPGDSITAIVVGVLVIKGIQPGPMVFTSSPELLNSLYIVFFLSNILMVPLGIIAIMMARRILMVKPGILYSIILLLCMMGSFATSNSLFDLWFLLIVGVVVWILDANDYPAGPIVLGLVLGRIVEENFMNSVLKSNGDIVAFFNRPVAGVLGAITVMVWLFPLFATLYRKMAGKRKSP